MFTQPTQEELTKINESSDQILNMLFENQNFTLEKSIQTLIICLRRLVELWKSELSKDLQDIIKNRAIKKKYIENSMHEKYAAILNLLIALENLDVQEEVLNTYLKKYILENEK